MFSETVIATINRSGASACVIDSSDKGVVLANLIFMHQVIIASEDLLITAANCLGKGSFDNDLRDYYQSHLEEEREHEAWLADDLRTAGIEVKSIPLMRKAVEMAGTQYYLIKHAHPAALLGYMAFLEGFPMPMEVVDMLEDTHGKDLFRTLRFHADHDLEHCKDLFKIIDTVPEHLHQLVLNSATQTAIYMAEAAKEWHKETLCHKT